MLNPNIERNAEHRLWVDFYSIDRFYDGTSIVLQEPTILGQQTLRSAPNGFSTVCAELLNENAEVVDI